MKYLFDPRSGQVRGAFSVEFDCSFDGGADYLLFKFHETRKMPTLEVEGSQLYIDFANIVHTGLVPLLDRDWIPFNEFESFSYAGEIETLDDEHLLHLAEKTGPLFGSYDESGNLITEGEIREPVSCWRDAARMLNFAIRAQAYLAERGSSTTLDDEVYYLLRAGRRGGDYWECNKFFTDELTDPYLNMLQMPVDAQRRLLLPSNDIAVPGHTFRTLWEPAPTSIHNQPRLSVSMIPSDMDADTVPVGYASHSYLASQNETAPPVHALLAQMVRALVLLHTNHIYHDLHDKFFGVAYHSLLERLWYSFASDAALGKLGICEHCSKVFEAMAERRDRKRFCSTECQEYAKSARNYRKRKIRDAIKSKSTTDVDYLLHVLDDPKITRELVESVIEDLGSRH